MKRSLVTLAAAMLIAVILAACSGGHAGPSSPPSISRTPSSSTSAAPATGPPATPSHASIQPNPSPPSTYVDVLHTGKSLPGAFTIMYALRAKGFDVSDVTVPPIVAMAKDALEVKVNGISAYLNAFESTTVTREWTDLSEGFGGIAVVGDTWSVSLDSKGETATPAQSKALATRIAIALNAKVAT